MGLAIACKVDFLTEECIGDHDPSYMVNFPELVGYVQYGSANFRSRMIVPIAEGYTEHVRNLSECSQCDLVIFISLS